VQMELTTRGVPFDITSGLRFFEQAHVKDVSAFLRFVTNRKDEVAFKRMVEMLPGIGAGMAEKMWLSWLKSGWHEKLELPESFSAILKTIKPPKKAEADWEQMSYILDEMIDGDKFQKPASMIYSVLEGMYDEYLQATFENYENRRGDIEKLLEYGNGFDDVMVFLEQLSLMSAVDGDPALKKDNDKNKVTLSSIHQAKGLEYKIVFLIWLADGQFPNSRVIDSDDHEALEEERRLFYVALTRAKDQLYMLYPMINPKSYSGDIMQRPSRFLGDFPAEMVEEWRVGSGWDVDDPF
jgi:DNA helicase II / ATP-dependent DNA helicase PcrA